MEGSGRFSLSVPAGSRVVLTFSKPGHLTKEVVVDTRNALVTPQAERTNRKVRFDVVLEPVRKRPGCKYDGPVGSLGFVNGSGTMKVKHTFSVVADQANPRGGGTPGGHNGAFPPTVSYITLPDPEKAQKLVCPLFLVKKKYNIIRVEKSRQQLR